MWIIPNNYQPSSASVLDTLGSKEDLSLQGLNIESSLMWRSKPSPLRTWSQRWSKVSWFRLLSTRILKPSHLISFETQLTSSLEDIRANRLAWQEERKPLTIPDTSSPTSSIMCEQLDLLSASSRMSKDTSTEDLNQSSKTWKAQVTIQRGEYSVRKKLAHLTKGNASSFLPTPTATPYGNNQGGAAGRTGQVRHSLESMAAIYGQLRLFTATTIARERVRTVGMDWRQRSRRIYGRPQQQRRDQEPTQRLGRGMD